MSQAGERGIVEVLVVAVLGLLALAYVMGRESGWLDGWDAGAVHTCAGLSQEVERVERYRACHFYTVNTAEIMSQTRKMEP